MPGDLQKEGVIVKVPGEGTFVATSRPSQELARLEDRCDQCGLRAGYPYELLATLG
jgi:DNA-binding GntR family transcriptional regulator